MTETARRFGIGVVGADPSGRGFGARAHLPGIAAVPGLELAAVCTAHDESARSAAALWGGVPYSDYREMVRDPRIDIVTVAVRVRLHRPIVEAALEAGKMVYCEWPLALDLAEAEGLLALQQRAGVPCAVGNQGRFNPAIAEARALLVAGELGPPLSFRVSQVLRPFGVDADRPWFAHEDEASGALNVASAHILDVVGHVLGPIASIAGWKGTKLPEGRFRDTGGTLTWTASDTVLALVRLQDGTVGSSHVTNTASVDEGFRLTVFCERGQVEVSAPSYISFSPAELRVAERAGGEWRSVPVSPPGWLESGTSITGQMVAIALHELARAATEGTEFHPGFDDGVRLHRVVDAVTRSSRERGWVDLD